LKWQKWFAFCTIVHIFERLPVRFGLYAPAMGNIAGKVAIVTGAAQGLGAAYAAALRAAGAIVATCDIQPGCDAVVDVSKAEDVKTFVDGVVATRGPIGILIANAGVCRMTNPLDPWEQAEADFDFHVGTNLRGLYLSGRAVLPSMVPNGGGHLVLVCTDHTARPADWPYTGGTLDSYDASKWGVLGLTTSWANALAKKGVRVNAVSMGATDTEMLRGHIRGATGREPSDEVVAGWMRPEQVASLVLELLEEGPTGRTGANIPVIVGRPIVLP
jgi:NAD(P)-dependent dehydrogenase (short-subunit alcohol dehydrogenase family)